MRLLLTSDWQADFANLQECDIILDELLAAADKYKPAAIIHAGDWKDQYSPVSTEVVTECVHAVQRIVEAGHRLIILLGNHDRVSQSSESKNWLSVLRAAGAEIVTKPCIKLVDSAVLGFLPYTSSHEELVERAQWLSARMDGHPGKKVLLFHAEIRGAVFNSGGMRCKGASAEEMCFASYDACFGGHIHRHQKITDNSWYIGSPFCQDWGEADSTHGHLLVTLTDDGVKVKQLRTKIPHWYNAEYLEQHGIEPESGAYIRSRVQVTTRKITDQLIEEDERLHTRYGADVRVYTVPVLAQSASDEVDLDLDNDSDSDKVKQFVSETLPESARFDPKIAITYMTSKLGVNKRAAVEGGEIKFKRAWGKNVLVFRDVSVRLSNLGVVLIRGVNCDLPKRSNGAGKTSLLSLIPISLFGQTLKKGQKADGWASERGDGTAEAGLILRDARNRQIEIIRKRPHSLSLHIDKKDCAEGIRGTGKDETQGKIERAVGYDFKTLVNAVYIDQSLANGFVFGTASDRMALVSRFLNLERFDDARKLVDLDIERNSTAYTSGAAMVARLHSAVQNHTASLERLEAEEHSWSAELADARSMLEDLIQQHAAMAGVSQTYAEMETQLDNWTVDRNELHVSVSSYKSELDILSSRMKHADELIAAGKCPECGQSTVKVAHSLRKELERPLAAATANYDKARKAREVLDNRIRITTRKLSEYRNKMDDLDDEIKKVRASIVHFTEMANAEDARNSLKRQTRLELESNLERDSRFLRAARSSLSALAIDRDMLEFAKKAFHRSGMPLYLATALCPLLNHAAEDYSEVFTDGALKVDFEVIDGEFCVNIINPTGSKRVNNQCVGESAMAGIIAAFALRESAPKTNLLILDEPGHGLDQEGARQFARGLLKLRERFESILVVTHSPAIESVLAGEHIWQVEKRGGWSKLSIMS